MKPLAQPPIKPIYTKEQMERIVSRQPSMSSEEFFRSVEAHLGRSLKPARKKVCLNGQVVWEHC